MSELAVHALGARVVGASDDAFGERERLLDPAPPQHRPGTFGPRGEVVDGWETRRHRGPGAAGDWVVIRLGPAGVVHLVELDATGFTGNHPERASVDAVAVEGWPGDAVLGTDVGWEVLAADVAVTGGGTTAVPIGDRRRFTHLRLRIEPDGGVARLRVHGEVLADPRRLGDLGTDLAARVHGGEVVASSDGYYSSAAALNDPAPPRHMGEGWETRRRRDGGHDWAVLRLGWPGEVRRAVVDTTWYRYNASAEVALWAGPGPDGPWRPLLARTPLEPDTTHDLPVLAAGPTTHVRIDAHPDGGLGRLRLLGHPDPGAALAVSRRWWAALPTAHAAAVLTAEGIDAAPGGPLPDALAERLVRSWGRNMRDAHRQHSPG